MQNVIDFTNSMATRLPGSDVQTRTVHVNGINIAFNLQGQGPPLVLVMGYRLNSSAWPREFLDVLARHFTLITLDNRGTGKSDKPVEGYSLANLARDVCGVLDHLSIQRAHILGYSMGGGVAQEFARQFPARVAGLVLCATMCGGPRAIYARLSVLRVMRELDGLRPEEIARRIWKVTYAPHYLAQNREKVEQQMLREIFSPTPLHAADLQFQAFSDFDCSLALPDVRAATLVLTGDADELIPADNSTVIAELIPGADLYVMRGHGHRVLWEAPERCATLIADFLTEVDKEREPGRIRESGRTEMTRAERAHEIGPADLLTDIAETWWRSMSLLARWPLNMGDFVGDFLIYTLQPAYFGRSPPLGNGKPIVIVPGDFANNLVLSNFTLWLKANGYRPTRAAIPIHVGDGMMDNALGDAIRAAARRVGRKAAIVAFKDGIRAALRVAAREPTYVSEVIGFEPPSGLSAGASGVRVHLIASDAVNAGQNATVHRAKEWPWPIATNPDALLILSKVLRETRIELLDSNVSQGA